MVHIDVYIKGLHLKIWIRLTKRQQILENDEQILLHEIQFSKNKNVRKLDFSHKNIIFAELCGGKFLSLKGRKVSLRKQNFNTKIFVPRIT